MHIKRYSGVRSVIKSRLVLDALRKKGMRTKQNVSTLRHVS